MSYTTLNYISEGQRFKAMIGTGGIGAGTLFLLNGNDTLGREESRGGKYLDARDYCKLHIIAHYVKALLGTDFPVYPVGKLGDDDVGKRIYGEMEEAGLNMEYVAYSAGNRTLFGFCFLYPDGTGGNLTTEESASTKVDPSFIETATPVLTEFSGRFISLSAPEVPLAARSRLLELAVKYKGFNVASFTSGEMKEAEATGMLNLTDLLAINIDEASALVGRDVKPEYPESIVEGVIRKMEKINPSAWLSVTAGRNGSWTWDGSHLSHIAIFPVEVISSAGAGDAHIAGIIAGLSAGLSLQQAQMMGNLSGAFSVTSPHTIHPELNRKGLRELVIRSGKEIDPELFKMLTD